MTSRHGLVGLLRLDGRAADLDDAARVEAMAAQIAHRGLARRDIVRCGSLAIAVGAALPPGDGPIVIGDGFNRADIAALYDRHGEAFVDHLSGAFAIAIWDPRRQALVLARDRAGVRPLFVAQVPGLLLFGSELKALLAHPACPREVDWLGTLARFALPLRSYPPHTYFLGVDAIAPGTLQVACRGVVETKRYWSLRFASEDEAAADRRTDDDIIAGYADALATAVDDAFGDRAPTGLFLSGGIDSIAIATLGRVHRPQTFTAFNQSTWSNGDARVARQAAEHLGLVNRQVVFRRGDNALTPDHWKKMVWTTESARCRGQDYLKGQLAHHAKLVAPELRVLLHGEGSDELIGADTRNYEDHDGEESYAIYLARLRGMQREEFHDFDTQVVETWFGGTPVFADAFLAAASGRPVPREPMQRRALYCLEGLAEIVLAREDRFAAANGLESRAPFVDHRLLEFVAAIPPRAYPTLYWRKHVLRHGLRRELPDALRLQRKVGFFAGVDGRFTTRMLVDLVTADDQALVRDALGDPDRHPILARGFVASLVAQTIADPESAAIDGLLTLVNLGLLEGMARDVAAQARLRAIADPPLTELVGWDEATFPALLADTRHVLDLDRELVLGAEVELARPEAGSDDDRPIWICIGSVVKYVVDGDETIAWRKVLRALRAGAPLREVLHELDVPLDAVRKHLQEALEFDVVAFATSSPGARS